MALLYSIFRAIFKATIASNMFFTGKSAVFANVVEIIWAPQSPLQNQWVVVENVNAGQTTETIPDNDVSI